MVTFVLKKKKTNSDTICYGNGIWRKPNGHRETRKEGFTVIYEGDCACLSMKETDEESSKASLSFTPTPIRNPSLCYGIVWR